MNRFMKIKAPVRAPETELSPESETLSGDIFMSKKISAEIRHQVLLLLRQGARAQSIATQLRLTKSWV